MAEETVMEENNNVVEEISTETSEAPVVAETSTTTGDMAEVEFPVTTEAESWRIADLAPKMELHGVVQSIELFGAFVDIGAERPGLLHISQINREGKEPVRNVGDFVKVGDALMTYVLEVDHEKQRVTLTLAKPPAMTWGELNLGDVVKATIVRIEKYGAFADIGAERPGLIHVSELADDYVGSPNTVVNVGDVVDAKIIGLDKRKKQIDLSIRQLEIPMPESEAREEELTAMAMALRQAFSNDRGDGRDRKRNKKKDRRRDHEQTDIIARTLHYHDNN